LRVRLRDMTDEQSGPIWEGCPVHGKPLRERRETPATGFHDSIGRGEKRVAKKTPKEFKPGQVIRVKLSNGRIEEARINHVLRESDSTKLLDFGHDETALVELWQVMED
jgi:hypothetical protein